MFCYQTHEHESPCVAAGGAVSQYKLHNVDLGKLLDVYIVCKKTVDSVQASLSSDMLQWQTIRATRGVLE